MNVVLRRQCLLKAEVKLILALVLAADAAEQAESFAKELRNKLQTNRPKGAGKFIHNCNLLLGSDDTDGAIARWHKQFYANLLDSEAIIFAQFRYIVHIAIRNEIAQLRYALHRNIQQSGIKEHQTVTDIAMILYEINSYHEITTINLQEMKVIYELCVYPRSHDKGLMLGPEALTSITKPLERMLNLYAGRCNLMFQKPEIINAGNSLVRKLLNMKQLQDNFSKAVTEYMQEEDQ